MSAEESRRLERLAVRDEVSSGEIIRRGVQEYAKAVPASEQETLAMLLREMNSALDDALVSVRSARKEIGKNLARLRQMRESRA